MWVWMWVLGVVRVDFYLGLGCIRNVSVYPLFFSGVNFQFLKLRGRQQTIRNAQLTEHPQPGHFTASGEIASDVGSTDAIRAAVVPICSQVHLRGI